MIFIALSAMADCEQRHAPDIPGSAFCCPVHEHADSSCDVLPLSVQDSMHAWQFCSAAGLDSEETWANQTVRAEMCLFEHFEPVRHDWVAVFLYPELYESTTLAFGRPEWMPPYRRAGGEAA